MINKMKMRTGGYANGVANSAEYLLKTNPKGDAIDCSIERLEGESDHAYAQRIEKIFESARVHNQKNLYQFNMLSLHPSEGDKFTDAQMIEMAKEVYLKNGVKNSLNENRHYMFVVERNTKHHHVHAMIHLTDLTTKKVNNKMIEYNPIIQKLELKYGLYNEHRKPKGEPENKKKLKDDLKAIRDKSISPSEFLILANQAGYEIHHNGNDAYSLTKDDQTFKASDLGMSYKTLKKALGDDPEFSNTLARLHTDKPENAAFGSIITDEQHSVHPARKFHKERFGGYWTKDNRFQVFGLIDGEHQLAFSYVHNHGLVIFQTSDPVAVELGLGKLTENTKPCKLHVNGTHDLKRNTWLEFHRMGLDKKGFTLKGYDPTPEDFKTLEKYKLEKHGNALDDNPAVDTRHAQKPLNPMVQKQINENILAMLKYKEEINNNKLATENSSLSSKNNSGPKLKPN
ncbi:relaxase/mobilization nuclease domain-containing protein [Pseudomonas aeruginosa]